MILCDYLVGSQVVFVFERDLQVRKKVFEYEDKLSSFFRTPFLMIPFPDEADGNIPRFEGESLNGFSRIQVSQYRTSLSTSYSDEFRKNISQVKEYIKTRVNVLKDIESHIHEIKYIGIIFDVFIEYDEKKINNYLKKITNFDPINSETIDFSVRYSLPYKSQYFLNIRVSKSRQDEVELDSKGRIIRKTGNKIHGINAMTDINSKLFIQKGNKFNFNIIPELENEIFNLVTKNKLENYLKGDIK